MPVNFVRQLTIASLLFIFVLQPCAFAENWPQWRGVDSSGRSTETSIATKWSKQENVAWRTPLPGEGGATPVIWGNRIFVSSADKSGNLVLLCISADDGSILWQRKVTDGNTIARRGEGNSASPSPATDGEHVWIFYSTGVLACFDVDGNEKWKFDVGDRFGRLDIQFGLTSTPVLEGDGLYLQLIHGRMARNDNSRTGKVIKLNKLTSETVWEQDRITDVVFECKHSYASPFLYDDGQRKFLVVHGADCTTGHSLETGEELWRFGGLNGTNELNRSRFDPTFRFVSSPAVLDGKIIIPTAKRGPTVAINVDDTLTGDVTGNSKIPSWVIPETPDVSIPLVVDGLVYLLHKESQLQCVDLETGKEYYFERTHGSVQHRSSPTYADGKIYFCGRDGMCTVVKTGPEFEILAQNDMGEPITASAVVSNGTLYLRSFEALYAIRK